MFYEARAPRLKASTLEPQQGEDVHQQQEAAGSSKKQLRSVVLLRVLLLLWLNHTYDRGCIIRTICEICPTYSICTVIQVWTWKTNISLYSGTTWCVIEKSQLRNDGDIDIFVGQADLVQRHHRDPPPSDHTAVGRTAASTTCCARTTAALRSAWYN